MEELGAGCGQTLRQAATMIASAQQVFLQLLDKRPSMTLDQWLLLGVVVSAGLIALVGIAWSRQHERWQRETELELKSPMLHQGIMPGMRFTPSNKTEDKKEHC